MTYARSALFAGLSAAALAAAVSTPAFAQAQSGAAPAADSVEAIVVTGSRVAGRTRLESVAPVDVISAQSMSHSGNTELAQALSVALPSLNFTRPAVTDGTDTVRPASLRGLSPDQTLVLLNSKRRHASSLVNLNGAIGYGSAAVDLNAIPTSAVGSIEVLRDGASAQYGSDAIAGVVNIRLREARSGGNLTVSRGEYSTRTHWKPSPSPVPGLVVPTSKYFTDGDSTTYSGWTGLPLGQTGFVTLSGEVVTNDHTTRAGPDPRQQYPLVGGAFDPREYTYNRINNWYGDPQLDQYTGYLNAGYDFSADARVYGWAGYQHRDAISAANVRRAIQQTLTPATNLLAVYPDGFLPKIEGKVTDVTAGLGSAFKTGDWNWDASVVFGSNKFEFGVIDSLNVSLGPTSQLQFDAGALRYAQTVGNLGVTRKLAFGGLSEVNFAAGAEIRHETYRITPGEPASYQNGGYITPSGTIGNKGSQGFPGFQPSDAVDVDRTSEALYVDLETKPVENFDVDLAGRYEHSSDFGDVWSGKLAARYDLTPNFALRGAVSNGFRAPSLQQEFVSYTAITFIAGNQINNAVLRASNPVAGLIGAVPLKPERSTNFSAGGVAHFGAFSATLDGYIIRINDRIALSDALTQANVVALFPASAQIGAARFFTNGVDTTTKGVEAVVSYRWTPSAEIGRFDFTASASHNETKIRALRSTPQLSALNPAPPFLTHYRTLSLTDGQPKWKGSLAADWTRGWLGATLKATYYGKLIQAFNGNNALGDYTLEPKTLIDAEVRANVWKGLQLAVGANNLLDTYPTTPPYVLNGQTISTNGVGAFPEYSPFGWQGRFLYGRVSYSW
ncbi:MAG TPA: TonB-dependent receptor [Caulobacteraceae bacterium]|jgi:iron complex outermembrane receptor protein|nr:TonB-dependent receptor [Caulobacteraceae bacterium]